LPQGAASSMLYMGIGLSSFGGCGAARPLTGPMSTHTDAMEAGFAGFGASVEQEAFWSAAAVWSDAESGSAVAVTAPWAGTWAAWK